MNSIIEKLLFSRKEFFPKFFQIYVFSLFLCQCFESTDSKGREKCFSSLVYTRNINSPIIILCIKNKNPSLFIWLSRRDFWNFSEITFRKSKGEEGQGMQGELWGVTYKNSIENRIIVKNYLWVIAPFLQLSTQRVVRKLPSTYVSYVEKYTLLHFFLKLSTQTIVAPLITG